MDTSVLPGETRLKVGRVVPNAPRWKISYRGGVGVRRRGGDTAPQRVRRRGEEWGALPGGGKPHWTGVSSDLAFK